MREVTREAVLLPRPQGHGIDCQNVHIKLPLTFSWILPLFPPFPWQNRLNYVENPQIVQYASAYRRLSIPNFPKRPKFMQ